MGFNIVEGDVVLYDSNGNPIVVKEGDSIGANTSGIMFAGKDPSGNAKFAQITAAGQVQVITSDSDVDLSKRVFSPLEDSSNNTNMYVDGSSTPVEYSFDADSTDDIYIIQIRFIINAADIQFKEGSGNGTFQKIDALTNGVKLEVRSDSSTYQLANIKRDEEFLAFGSNDILDQTDTSDLFSATLDSGGILLVGGSADFIKVTIRDDLENAGHIFFGCWIKGYKV